MELYCCGCGKPIASITEAIHNAIKGRKYQTPVIGLVCEECRKRFNKTVEKR